ncbi:MAG: hypothetical protein WCI34_02350 [Actinomycetes bacterium]
MRTLKRPITKILLLAVMVVAFAPTGALATTAILFKTSSGNIQCSMVGSNLVAAAKCHAKVHDWAQPKSCPAGWQFAFMKTSLGTSHGSPTCVHGGFPATNRIILLGKKFTLGPITCTGSGSGVTCLSHHHGFFISRHSYKHI